VRDSPAGRRRFGRSTSAAVFLGGSTALAALSAALILTRHPFAAGLASAGAAGCLVAGAVHARAGGAARVRFAGSLAGRLLDACLLVPLAWVWQGAEPRVSALALVGLGAAFTASYQRAKAASLAYRVSEGLGYRAAGAALPAAGLLTGWVEASLWAFAAMMVVATGVRASSVASQHARERRLGPAGGLGEG
jgi:hypothetical protein